MSVYYPLGRGEDMSEGEYQYQVALCESAGLEDIEPVPPPAPVGYWRVRGGALLEIVKMSTEHLKNAINYSERNRSVSAKIDELREELGRRA